MAVLAVSSSIHEVGDFRSLLIATRVRMQLSAAGRSDKAAAQQYYSSDAICADHVRTGKSTSSSSRLDKTLRIHLSSEYIRCAWYACLHMIMSVRQRLLRTRTNRKWFEMTFVVEIFTRIKAPWCTVDNLTYSWDDMSFYYCLNSAAQSLVLWIDSSSLSFVLPVYSNPELSLQSDTSMCSSLSSSQL